MYDIICVLAILGIASLIPRKIYITWFAQIQYCYIGITYCIKDQFNVKYNKDVLPLMSNKIAIVTGGSRGIGAEVVKKLLQCDMEVIIACRNTAAGEKLIQEIKESGITTGHAKAYKFDNASFKSIKKFVQEIKRDYDKIHVLINNAGVMFPIMYKETEDGFEEQWAVNYLSHFLLSSLLLPLLQAGGCSDAYSRIINVTSCAHDISIIDFDSICHSSKDSYSSYLSYGQSKLAQTMFTIILQQLMKAKSLMVQTYSVHPGIVRTDLFKNTFLGQHKWLTLAWKTPEEGARSIVYAAVNEEIENKGGIFISNCKESSLPQRALVEETQKKLFQISLNQVQLDDFFQYL